MQHEERETAALLVALTGGPSKLLRCSLPETEQENSAAAELVPHTASGIAILHLLL